jgi:NADH-quinone oxidoreductase subunit E
MFAMPDMPTPMTMLDHMTKRTTAMMPAELASAVNLMAHPIAASAAMSALGAGMAGHAMGVWFGTLSGAAAASQRVFLQFAETEAPDVDAFRDALRTPAMRATEAATALITDVETAAETASPKVRRLSPKAKPGSPDRKPAGDGAVVEKTIPAEPPQALEAAPEPTSEPTPMPEPASGLPAVAPAAAESAPDATRMDAAPAPAETPAAEAPEEIAAGPRQPAAVDRPDLPDDLKSISGIGPKLEQVLNGLGVWTYAQIAVWSEEEVGWVDDHLGFKGRIGRDDWIGQARGLVAATDGSR